MPRKPKTIPGPSRLSRILAHLMQEPRPFLPNLKSLQLTYAYRNDHFGARYVHHVASLSFPSIQLRRQTFREGRPPTDSVREPGRKHSGEQAGPDKD